MLEDLVDRPLGPYPFRTDDVKIREFVEATGDDPDRWAEAAPPGFASTGLFAVASPFLADPAVRSEGASILHGEQRFRWHEALPRDESLEVTGHLRRVRRRRAATFVWLSIDLSSEELRIVESDSMFVLTPDVQVGTVEASEPPPDLRAANDEPGLAPFLALGQPLPAMAKSASRTDLIRYAAATGDWNPIHWDHASAVQAGLEGVICHGLLMAAWALQSATQVVEGPAPLSEARIRFRAPLRPAVQASVLGKVAALGDGEARVEVTVASDEIERVAATVMVRSG